MVHPSLEPYVNAVRAEPVSHPSLQSADERRAAYRDLALSNRGETESVESVRDVELPLEGRTLRARLYVPFNDESKALVIYFHGGGFVVGDLDTHDALCRRICRRTRGCGSFRSTTDCAPEHPLPGFYITDAVDTIRYVRANLGDFDDAEAELIVMGDSAGATLLTVACAL